MMVLSLFVQQNDTTPLLSVSLRTAGSVDGSALRKTLALWLFSVAE